MQVLEKYRLNFNIDEDQEGPSLTTYKENIVAFQTFAKKVIPTMEVQKKQMKIMMDTKTNIDLNYKTIINGLLKYEDNNVEYYSETDVSKRTLTHPSAGDVKERFEETYSKWKNPFKDAYLWIKGELLDVKGISEALLGREFVVKQQSTTEAKRRSDQAELEKLSQGKKTLKSIFKSKSSKENDILNLQAGVEVANKDIEDFKKLVNFLTIYHGQMAT